MARGNRFKTRRLEKGVVGLYIDGFDENGGKDNEKKSRTFITIMAGRGVRKEINRLRDGLNGALNQFYGVENETQHRS